jgi:phospholipid/cholesterol/gamma-HCH transport system ATP-binding protein
MSAARADGSPMIRVEDVTIGYGERVLMSGVSFDVGRGEVFVVLGGSGCGKSSLLKTMIGLNRPLAGRILIDGRDLAAAHGGERARIQRGFGVMYQSGALFGSLTVHENVRLPLDELTDLPEAQKDVLAHTRLKMVGLEQAGRRRPAELSGGMVKRAAIARALALDPPLVFLDEPSAGLDPVTSAGLDALILDLARNFGITFVVVTHELQSIFAIADRCVMLDASRRTLVAEGRPAELRDRSTDPAVLRFFRREAEPPAPPRSETS